VSIKYLLRFYFLTYLLKLKQQFLKRSVQSYYVSEKGIGAKHL